MEPTPEQIEHIERLKKEFGIDQNLGDAVSKQSVRRGPASGIAPITSEAGRKIAEGTFNPIIKRMIADLGR